MNLVINASEAIGDRDGVIRVITRCVTIGPDAVTTRLAGGDYLQLEVSDTGDGMSAETQGRLFDPFFTTKLAGRGLGLAVVDGIVRSLRGSIQVVSELGKGTRFQVLLPVAETTAVATSEAMSSGEVVETSQEFAVLVVEDEEALRQAVVRLLQRAGFEVSEAANGTAAIDLLRAEGGQIDVILLDMNIPGASSHEIAAVAAQVRPDLKVVLTSAYGEEIVRTTASAPQTCSFIRKPYQLDVLVQTLQNVLGRDTTSEVVRRATP
jgi:CheY-like chemotaxis protein